MKNTETKLKGNPENSRNVRRTKLALRNSLIELMKNKSILRISVKEICDTADVGRSTFMLITKVIIIFLKKLKMRVCLFLKKNCRWINLYANIIIKRFR